MKRTQLTCFLFILSVLLLISGTAFADGQESLPYYVSDTAGLMTSTEWQKLENTAETISEKYGCGVYIVTLDNFRDFGSYDSFWDFSEAFYNRYNMGMGDPGNGILLIMSMAERDYSLIAKGSNAHYAFTDYGKSVLEDRFLDNFRRSDWYGGFEDYLDGCGELLARAAAGSPLDISYESRSGLSEEIGTGIIIGLPLLVGVGTCEGMRRRMKPVRPQCRADEYIVPGSIRLNVKKDTFINRTVSRTVIRTENRDSSHHGGGGTTVNSHGFSGHSGKF